MPRDSAMSTASTDPHTDMAPLIPHRNAVGAFGRNDAIFIPIGKGIPMEEEGSIVGRRRDIEGVGGGEGNRWGCSPTSTAPSGS
jgi:hypothetical protein